LGTLLVTLIHLSCDFNAVGGLCVNMAKDCQGQPEARAAANTLLLLFVSFRFDGMGGKWVG